MFPGSLARATHHEQIAVSETKVQAPLAPALGSQPKRSGFTQRHGGDERLGSLPGNLVAVPRNAVVAIAVQRDADPVEGDSVPRVEPALNFLDDTDAAAAGRQLADEPRHIDEAVVHGASVLGPVHVLDEFDEEFLVTGQPARRMIDPGTASQLPTHAGSKARRRWFLVPEERWLAGEHRAHATTLPEHMFACERRLCRPSITVVLHLVTTNPPRGEHLTVDSFDDLEAVGEAFRAGARVTAELRGDDRLARRAVDFMSGLTYALDGDIERVADRVFLLVPSEMESAESA